MKENKTTKEISWKKFLIATLTVALFCSGFSSGVTWYVMKEKEKKIFSEILPLRQSNTNYKFIDPLLAYQIPSSKDLGVNVYLEKSLNSLVQNKLEEKSATEISIYYRNLIQGRWVGINENKEYMPASLLKVVIMVALLKQSETDPSLLGRKVVYSSQMNEALQVVPFQTPSSLEVGKPYTVNELITILVKHSDNGAKNVLLQVVDPRVLADAYTDLGMKDPGSLETEYLISAKTYSLFLRILYNATYLSRENSEKALELLAGAEYKDGLAGGVPAGVLVSHKFGEAVMTGQNIMETSLHDCGIVYKPNNAYILCVMTKGGDLKKLTEIIQEVSKVVYIAEQ